MGRISDGSLEEIFDLQDQVAVSIAGIIEPTLQVAEIRHSLTRCRYILRVGEVPRRPPRRGF